MWAKERQRNHGGAKERGRLTQDKKRRGYLISLMIDDYAFWRLSLDIEHACCLASLHVLFSTPGVSVWRSHPQRQETSSACWGEVFYPHFCRRICGCLRCGAEQLRYYAVLRERTKFILGEFRIGAILEDSGRRIEQGASPCLSEIFGREGVPILEVVIQHQRGPWEDSVDPQGMHFRRSSFSETLSGIFWVL